LRSFQQLVLQTEVHVGLSVRRAFSETAISVGALGVLAVALAASDVRVRDRIATHLSRPDIELASAGALLRDVMTIVFQAARDQSVEHAPLMIFVAAAGALLLFMLRT
jgi:hypothetical protein